ncbi:MAG: anti-sigma factor domain-containing protein [Pyrinomonadaceae bacterium]
MTHQEYKELMSIGALFALDSAEARSLVAHLESCPECPSEMDVWENTAALLAFDASPLAPSAQVRERILSAVRAEKVEATAKQTAPAVVDKDRRQPQSPGRSTVVPFERPPKTVWTTIRSSYAVAASVGLVALAISLFVIWQQNRAARAELARVTSEKSEAQQQLAHEREVLALITSPGTRMTELAGTNVAPNAHAMIAYDKNGRAMVMAKGLPAAPAGKAYQLWFILGNKPMPGRVFTTDTQGNGSLQDQIPAEAMSGAVFAITLEPASGVQSPTGAIYLSSGA